METNSKRKRDSLSHILKSAISDSNRANLLYELSLEYVNIDLEISLKYARQAEELSVQKGLSNIWSKTIYIQGCAFLNYSKPDSARKYFYRAINAYKKVDDQKGLAASYNGLASSYFYEKAIDSSLSNYKKAVEIDKKTNQPVKAALVLSNISVILADFGMYHESLDYAFEAIEIFKEEKAVTYYPIIYENIGSYYRQLKEFKLAKEYFYKWIAHPSESETNKIYAYSELGWTYYLENDYDSALIFMNKALSLQEPGMSDSKFGSIYSRVADVYLSMENTDSAYVYLTRAKEKFEKSQIVYEKQSIQQKFILYYYLKNNYTKAINKSAELLNDSTINLENRTKTNELLFKSYLALNNYKKAFEYQKIYFALKDSMNFSENSRLIFQKQKEYEYEQKEQQVKAEYEKHLYQSKAESSKRRLTIIILIISLGALILILSIISYSLRIKKRDNKTLIKQKEEIEQQEKLASRLLRELNHRVKNNLQMVSALFTMQIYKYKNPEVVQALKDARYRVDCLSLLHQHLYNRDYNLTPPMDVYIEDLANNILMVSGMDEVVDLKLKIDKINLKVEQSAHIGLIINELITNAVKYGVDPQQTGNWIEVAFGMEEDKSILRVSDAGLNKVCAATNDSSSFGLKLVETLSEQYGGNVLVNFGETSDVIVELFLN